MKRQEEKVRESMRVKGRAGIISQVQEKGEKGEEVEDRRRGKV